MQAIQVVQAAQALVPALEEGRTPGRDAWLAVGAVSVSTLAGAWLARRDSKRLVVWLAIASATMLVIALTDLLPDAWREAVETGVPLWVIGLAAAIGFLVITYFTRKGCGHEHESEHRPAGRHAPGRHRRLKEAVGAAMFGGMGTAAALTTHRAIEGATLAFSASVVVVLALMVHSASEGLALAALLDMARQRLVPWLVVSCVSPAIGVLFATVGHLPGRVVPVLLGMITGVLARTAIVGIKLAASKQENGRLSRWHVVVATATAVTVGVVLTIAHASEGPEAHHSGQGPGGTRPKPLAVDVAGQASLSPGQVRRPGAMVLSGREDPAAPSQATPRPRQGSRATGAPARRDRAALLAEVKSGRTSLAEVLRRTDDTARRLRVGRLIRALPYRDLAKVTASPVTGGLDEKRRVGSLSDHERRELLDVLGVCVAIRQPSQPPVGRPSQAPARAPAGDDTCSCGPPAPRPTC
ncbi:MAG: hypothetical protein ACRDOO_09590 [Actinomadura sp.]